MATLTNPSLNLSKTNKEGGKETATNTNTNYDDQRQLGCWHEGNPVGFMNLNSSFDKDELAIEAEAMMKEFDSLEFTIHKDKKDKDFITVHYLYGEGSKLHLGNIFSPKAVEALVKFKSIDFVFKRDLTVSALADIRAVRRTALDNTPV